jgi:cobalamin biosynthesis protein CobT
MGRRVLNRKELRNDFDAAERTAAKEEDETEDEEEGDEEEEEGDEEAEEEGEEAEEDEDAAADDEDGGGDDDDEDGPKKKKKKKVKPKAVPKAKPKSRSRVAKVVRMRVVWGVFNNSNQMVASYEYSKKDEAEAHAARLIADKRSTHFIQPVKEPIEEKKEK